MRMKSGGGKWAERKRKIGDRESVEEVNGMR